MKFTELKKHIQENGIQPIYYLDGEELYFRDKGIEMLRSQVEEPSFNYTSFTSVKGMGGVKDVVDAVYTLPFLSEKRMVLVNDFYPTEKEYSAVLKGIFENPIDTTVLVISNVGQTKPKSGACDLKKKPHVTYIDCSRADETTVAKWIFLTFKQAGVRADGSVCNAIQKYCISDMSRVAKEVEKLIQFAGEGGVVTLRDVDELVYKDSEFKIYELTQAAAAGNYTQFMTIMDSMVGKGYDETAFLNALLAYFRTLCEVSECKGSNAQVAEELGMKEYAVKKSREQASKFRVGEVEEYYSALYSAMATARAGELTFPAALKTVIAKIFFKIR